MNPKDLIRAGKLSEAREQLTAEVKASPSDVSKRVLLFQVLSFYGEWDKAGGHLDVIASLDPRSETGVQTYKNLIQAEKERQEVYTRKKLPGFLGGIPSYLELYFTAWEKLNQKKLKEARALYDKLSELRPKIAGNISGKSFSGFRDTDTFLSFFLEAIVHERYIWIPFESLRELSVRQPKTLFDLLWSEARIVTWEGLTINCYVPVLYPDSFLHHDDRVKLGRLTDWKPLGSKFARASGQHVFGVNREEVAILELGDVTFKAPEAKRH
ncbi:MAG TPA: type VI secretion system accessory protein TagJ [Syntrophorhabdales bacterium]|nr:type VI secretion system accessory protein TagJ [Syntrophorhabdales bacterium]